MTTINMILNAVIFIMLAVCAWQWLIGNKGTRPPSTR